MKIGILSNESVPEFYRDPEYRAAIAAFFMYYIYILYSEIYDRFYVGSAEDISSRFERHNKGMVKATKPYIPWLMLYFEEYSSRSEAMKREKEIKNKKSRKYIEWLVDTSR